MKKWIPKIIVTAISSLLLLISQLNNISDFIKKIGDFNMTENIQWIPLLSSIGTISLPLVLVYFIWRIYLIEKHFEKHESSMSNLENIKSNNAQFGELLKINVKHHNITTRLFRDIFIIPDAMENDTKQEEYALWFYSGGYNVKELNEYGVPDEILKRIARIYHEEEAKKLKQ